jgi:hypothetical protein
MSETNRSVGDISDLDVFFWAVKWQLKETPKEKQKYGQETRSFLIANVQGTKGVCARAYLPIFSLF